MPETTVNANAKAAPERKEKGDEAHKRLQDLLSAPEGCRIGSSLQCFLSCGAPLFVSNKIMLAMGFCSQK